MQTNVQQCPAVEPDFTLPAVQAHYIEQAADHIAAYGLHEGDWWEQRYDEHGLWQPHAGYQDGSSCCTVGAIAVSLGYRSGDDVHNVVCGLDPDDVKPAAPHPVLAALMQALNAARVEDVFDWSDSARDDQVVARLRDIAAQLRAQAACIDPDDTVHEHCSLHGCVEYVCCVPAAVA
jgi:hypothetical protein